jgi:AAHS family 4-hydroxybenzoate transporter-like MFS transporter
VIICCFLVVMLDGFDTAAIGFIAPISASLAADRRRPRAAIWRRTAGPDRRALLCGPLSDRFGRKRVIEFCVALFGLFSLLSALLPDLQMLVFLRFLTGLGLGGAMPNTITMTSEYLPAGGAGRW